MISTREVERRLLKKSGWQCPILSSTLNQNWQTMNSQAR